MQTGVITTVAGNGLRRFDISSGQALTSSLASVAELAIDSTGHLYARSTNFLVDIDLDSNQIRRLAGGLDPSFNGDNVSLLISNIGSITGFAFDSRNNFYFADPGQNRVKKVTFQGVKVLPAPLQIIANDVSIVYGQEVPELTFNVTDSSKVRRMKRVP